MHQHPIFCKSCNINWARVHTCNHGDETYDYCPECGSDMDLMPGSPLADAFIKNPFTGLVINTRTKQAMQVRPQTALQQQKPTRPLFAAEKQAKKKLARYNRRLLHEASENAAIEAYLANVS